MNDGLLAVTPSYISQAGLFAGIVSSFVIDSLKNLQENSEEQSLGNILLIMRGGQPDSAFRPSKSDRVTNGLWITSLAITIIGSILAVLAKAWLANFVPASTSRREANYKDALRRYRLDRQAEQWGLEAVITILPFFVQMAACLFLLGLTNMVLEFDSAIGNTLVVFCAGAMLSYGVMTALPFWSPTTPFNTPLSTIFSLTWALLKRAVYGLRKAFGSWRFGAHCHDEDAVSAEDNQILAEIMNTNLLRSLNPLYVDEAIKEIASRTLKDKWLGYLGRKGAAKLILERFRECASIRFLGDMENQVELLGTHMLALLHLLHYHETHFSMIEEGKTCDVVELRRNLRAAVHDPSSPLWRWHRLPETLRPLLFALRAQILTLSYPRDGHTEEENVDIEASELQDRPWEMIFPDIQSGHRLQFALALCRGLQYGQDNLRSLCAPMLGLWLAKGESLVNRDIQSPLTQTAIAMLAIDSKGHRTEWEDIPPQWSCQIDQDCVHILGALWYEASELLFNK